MKHTKLKLIILTTFSITTLLTSIANCADFFYNYEIKDQNINKTEIATILKQDSVDPQNSTLYKFRKILRLTGRNYDNWDKTLAVDYIKRIINIALWLVWFISLILTLYAFYLMFFSKQEEWFEKAKKILKWVIIAIVIMWLSYFITSMIFYFFWITSWTIQEPAAPSSKVQEDILPQVNNNALINSDVTNVIENTKAPNLSNYKK